LPTESSQFLSRQTEPRDPTEPGEPPFREAPEGESRQKDEAAPRVATIVCDPGLLLSLLLPLLFVLFVLLKRRKLGFSNCLGASRVTDPRFSFDARALLEALLVTGEWPSNIALFAPFIRVGLSSITFFCSSSPFRSLFSFRFLYSCRAARVALHKMRITIRIVAATPSTTIATCRKGEKGERRVREG
jgi:hypothetical protein